jgi:abhydrolase domain-containing protein 13
MALIDMALNLLSHMIWSLLALGGGLLLLVYLVQDKMVYVPDIEMSRTQFLNPADYGLEDWEELFLPTPDGEQIQVWFFRAPRNPESAATMLYFHGNAGSIQIIHFPLVNRAFIASYIFIQFTALPNFNCF